MSFVDEDHERTLREAHAVWVKANQGPIHGTRSRYRKGCRCDQCRSAETRYRAAYRDARKEIPRPS